MQSDDECLAINSVSILVFWLIFLEFLSERLIFLYQELRHICDRASFRRYEKAVVMGKSCQFFLTFDFEKA